MRDTDKHTLLYNSPLIFSRGCVLILFGTAYWSPLPMVYCQSLGWPLVSGLTRYSSGLG